jgi:hypothetical protein
MADQKTRVCAGGVQDTGNPVFDATVNVAMSMPVASQAWLREIHATLLELYEKEPKRANPAKRRTLTQFQDDAKASPR